MRKENELNECLLSFSSTIIGLKQTLQLSFKIHSFSLGKNDTHCWRESYLSFQKQPQEIQFFFLLNDFLILLHEKNNAGLS